MKKVSKINPYFISCLSGLTYSTGVGLKCRNALCNVPKTPHQELVWPANAGLTLKCEALLQEGRGYVWSKQMRNHSWVKMYHICLRTGNPHTEGVCFSQNAAEFVMPFESCNSYWGFCAHESIILSGCDS